MSLTGLSMWGITPRCKTASARVASGADVAMCGSRAIQQAENWARCDASEWSAWCVESVCTRGVWLATAFKLAGPSSSKNVRQSSASAGTGSSSCLEPHITLGGFAPNSATQYAFNSDASVGMVLSRSRKESTFSAMMGATEFFCDRKSALEKSESWSGRVGDLRGATKEKPTNVVKRRKPSVEKRIAHVGIDLLTTRRLSRQGTHDLPEEN